MKNGSMSGGEGSSSPSRFNNPQFIRGVQRASRFVTAIFIIALIVAIYQAVVQENPLPLWAWVGMIALLAAAVGLAVALVVYRGVSREAGPFNLRASNRGTGELKHEIRQIELGGANSLRTELKMAQGILALDADAPNGVEGQFDYDSADWEAPQVEYAIDDAGHGDLRVEQHGTGRPAMRQGPAEWTIHLQKGLPINLDVNLGAGKADLDLSGLTLSGLHVEGGVGELHLNLSDGLYTNFKGFIKAGIGDSVIHLPKDVGVRIQSTVALGSMQSHGLMKNGETYTNDLFGKTPTDLDLTIQGGIGKIRLE